MRENRWKIRQELPWIILVAASEGFFTFVLWLAAPDAFGSIAVMAAIFAVLVIASGCIIGKRRQERQMDALQACREELEEAASIDGSSFTRTMFLIILPLVKPVLVTCGIISFFHIWNEFPFSLILLNNRKIIHYH